MEKPKEYAQKLLKLYSEDGAGFEEQILLFVTLDEANDEDLDAQLVEKSGVLADKTEIPPFDDTWRWDYHLIAKGEFPLEKLPSHVRDLAQRLYYS
jgi:hypothetical protein